MVCLSRSDLIINVASQKGNGSIHIRQGQIHHSQTDLLSGTDAFFEILHWNDGRFEILAFEDNGIDSVSMPWEHLLLDAMRMQDEKGIENGSGMEFPEDPGPDILAKIDDMLGDLLEFDQYPQVQPEREPGVNEASCSLLKVLIVDDSAFFSKKLKSMLEIEQGIQVVGIARNGKESLELLESGTPVHLITLDINMPVMAGDTALKHIMIRYRNPVLIVSSIAPHSIQTVLDFLELGAVDYIAKPGVHDDLTCYGANLRKLVKAVAKARVSNFRRPRKRNNTGQSHIRTTASAGHKILIIVGAEGAHMDWLRLPLDALCRRGPVIGIQKLDNEFTGRFARFIEDKTGVKTESLSAFHGIAPGGLYLTNARHEAEFKGSPEKPPFNVEVISSTALDWEAGLRLWLERLAEVAGDAVAVYFMSAAEPLSGSLISRLIELRVRHILPPPESVVCSQMIDSIKPYADHFPDLIFNSSSDTLTEVFYK
jgi:two-component system chemotaxis response regulator CheB